jgi:Protein of unknown function, DUF481
MLSGVDSTSNWLSTFLGIHKWLTIGWRMCDGADDSRISPWFAQDKFHLSLGTFITDYDSKFRLTSSKLGIGTRLDFEDDLGLDESSTVLRIASHYRLSARHRLDFSYLDLSRDGKTETRFPIIIDDTLFRSGSSLKTEFDYQVLKLAYAYSFWQTDDLDVSASAGLYTFNIGLKFESNNGQQEGDDKTTPFPMFGLQLKYRLSEQLYFSSSHEYFSINENFEGKLTDSIVALEYRPFEHFGFGLGYSIVTLFAEDKEGDDEFDYEYGGYLSYVSWSF